jgi:hypothetical protein
MRRVLAPGGRLALAVWRGLEANDFMRALCETEHRHLDVAGMSFEDVAAPFLFGDAAALRDVVAGAGFEGVEVAPRAIEARFPAADFVATLEHAYSAVVPAYAEEPARFQAFVAAVGRDLAPIVERHRRGDEVVFPMAFNLAVAIAVKVLSNSGFGVDGSIIAGLMHAVEVGADIVNMSIVGYLPRGGGCYTDGDCDTAQEVAESLVAYNRAIRHARQNGITVIVAAGNEGLDLDHPIHDPPPETGIASGADIIEVSGGLEGVISVAATGPYGWGGWAPDNCGLWRSCDTCTEDQVCGWDNTCCTPEPCQGECGWAPDGCGGYVECPSTCAEGQVCAPGNSCCTPTTCAERGLECGYTDDGCGNFLECPYSCGDGEVCRYDDNSCCTPSVTCESAGAACGPIDDGCGGWVWCGECGEGEVCLADNSCGPAPRYDAACTCADGTMVTACDRLDCFESCDAACADHGYYVWDYTCTPADPSCVSTVDPPFQPPFGPARAACVCADGSERAACTDVDCGSSGALDALCGTACEVRGGLAGTTCEADAPFCNPPPPPPGPDLQRCWCADGTQLDLCAEVDCDSGPAQDEVCAPACAPHGGLQGTGCLSDDPSCAAP